MRPLPPRTARRPRRPRRPPPRPGWRPCVLCPETAAAASPALPLTEDVREVEAHWLLQLVVGAGLRGAVLAPPHELGGVPEARALHVVVPDLDDPLGPQRREGQVLAGIPPAG